MYLKHVVGTAAILAIAMAAPVSAHEEISPPRLIWFFLSEGVKQGLGMRPAWEAWSKVPKDVPAAAQGAGDCEVLRRDDSISVMRPMEIVRPGKYCLDRDYEFACSPSAHDCAGRMIDIRASNVDLDFRGHTLRMSGTRRYRGVWGTGQKIRVHNGRIEGAGAGVTLMDRGSSPGNAYPDMPVDTDDVFSDTGFVVENMQFSGVLSAIEIAGSGNLVRDNRIDAMLDATTAGGPPFALLSYGPFARIVRNTFHLRELTPGWSGHAMYLRSADGTQVGDNTVSVDGACAGTVGIGLSRSRDIVLHRNQLDTEKMTDLDWRSSLDSAAMNGVKSGAQRAGAGQGCPEVAGKPANS
ncbi:hypothetical protein GJV26_29360 [Massilia dura]|uniref:Right handed beta helix domain-containing protein n=1 Tax=Pseudoduganella dura TaxID=321982 RepID=A0A6I3XIV7_9BURK|nr:right-handed parallel beta-helix repeat-containing protein [Pseudoduganella dura]MUI16537.1 hypothetical protein [Pseudoduganella dura]GGY11510.1 hypothetical protein GCM10007386_47220 [Pseudoduganella dura]